MKPSELPEFRARTVREFERVNASLAANEARAAKEQREAKRATRPDLVTATRLRAEMSAEIVRYETRLRDINAPLHVQPLWRQAELFWVTPEMTNLAAQAEATMPGFELHRDDLPADIGLIYFPMLSVIDDDGRPTYSDDWVAVWGPDWSDTNDGAGITLVLCANSLERGDTRPLPVIRINIRYGEDMVECKDAEGVEVARLVRCCWLLMQQRVASVSEERPDRASARRLTRAGLAADPVRVISLRRSSAGGTPKDSGREYVHRWVVKGHWRKQWYATQERHVPIWISPFIKGPDDAPLLGGEKVYAWRK